MSDSNSLKRQRDDPSREGTESEFGSSNSDANSDFKRQNTAFDPSEGLSVNNGKFNMEESENLQDQPIELEVINSSSSDSNPENESDIEETNAPTNDEKNTSPDHSDSDDDSDISEFQFEIAESPENDIPLDLYGLDFKLPPLNQIKVTKKICFQVRKYLKSEGHVAFLDLFLPSNPTPEDIVTLTKLLGFKPRKIKKILSTELLSDALHASIFFLREAINRVLKTRSRLPDFHTIKNVCDALENAENVLILTGAGISTSLGIPDFRSSQGFYSKMRNLGLDDPQEVFSLELFKRDPSIFYSIAYMILPPDDTFTPLHGFIKLLQDKGKLLRNYTQNIDNLEATAGVAYDKMIQCHGSFATASCITCKYRVPGETLYPNLRAKKIAYCPFCENERKNLIRKYEKMEDEIGYSSKFENIESFGVMKPDITFFGENLPDRYHNTIKEDVRKCDLLICIGTSLKVAPVSEIVNRIPEEVPQILINRDSINHCEFDVELLGYCDQAITWLCGKKLNWEINHKDFQKLLNSGLELETIDEEFGRYKITDADERSQISLKKLETSKEILDEAPANKGEDNGQKGEISV